jgi:hypothetical protein
MNLEKLFEKTLKEAHLQEMADCNSVDMINDIDEYFYQINRKQIDHRNINEHEFDPANFPIQQYLEKCYEYCCGEEFLTFVNPPAEEEWFTEVKNGLNNETKIQQMSQHNRPSYIRFIKYIIDNQLLENALNAVRANRQQEAEQNSPR